ncbi:hypothetical protein FB451DRAFT_1375264 [Mycena latifolia]|nr:hypothetical protein FB451DRAFT_1375264 [Mycena latifolia]
MQKIVVVACLLELGTLIYNGRHGVLVPEDTRAVNFACSNDDFPAYNDPWSALFDHLGFKRLLRPDLGEEVEVAQSNGAEIWQAASTRESPEDQVREITPDWGETGFSEMLKVPPAMVKLLQFDRNPLDMEGKDNRSKAVFRALHAFMIAVRERRQRRAFKAVERRGPGRKMRQEIESRAEGGSGILSVHGSGWSGCSVGTFLPRNERQEVLVRNDRWAQNAVYVTRGADLASASVEAGFFSLIPGDPCHTPLMADFARQEHLPPGRTGEVDGKRVPSRLGLLGWN